MKKTDKLGDMFEQQEKFMRLLQEKRNFPDFPVDLSSKKGQQLVRDISYHCMDELFESRQHLKNSKSHRITEIKDIDREAYIEELVDALHLFFEVCIASGISVDELYDAYMKKGQTNFSRIENGY